MGRTGRLLGPSRAGEVMEDSQEGETGGQRELGSRTDRDIQPYRMVGGWGSNRKKQMPELGPGCLEHGTPFTSRKSWRKWPGPEERMTQAGLLAPTPPPQSRGLLLSASHSPSPLHSCSRVPPDKGPAGLTVRFPRGLPPGQRRGEADG